METQDLDTHALSTELPGDHPSCQPNSFEEKVSDVEEKELEGKPQTLSPQTTESGAPRRAEPKRAGKSQERRPRARSRNGSSSSPGTGLSLVTSGKRDDTDPDSVEETPAARRRGRSRARRVHRKRPRAWSPGDQPPPLRRSLVTTLRTLSEAIYQDMVQVRAQQAQAPLTWEQLLWLSQLRGSLHATIQTFYTLANQAAYVFPAESWLTPTPLPVPRDPARHREEAQEES
ncbi:PREDICTED: protein FRG2-like [Chrysochloris asiatica]|uniref:Protein FRG2-like n=1 Tax=Chrysochloris asiatica TaxID=185453 RepID=A0A9B0X084_CHRAS|nr:PREDICTED: protein FRG2-like [Chrysochloris asiatica]